MNYLDCPGDHLKPALIGLAVAVAAALVLGLLFPLPDSLLGGFLGSILGVGIGFFTVRASAMIGHHLTCGRKPR